MTKRDERRALISIAEAAFQLCDAAFESDGDPEQIEPHIIALAQLLMRIGGKQFGHWAREYKLQTMPDKEAA